MSHSTTPWDHCLDHVAMSDVGMRRANNQDSMAVALASDQEAWLKRGHLFMVADGMGAHAAGEMASKLATDNVPLSFLKHADLPPPQALAKAVLEANELIHRRGQSIDDFKGMGTTSTALLLSPQGAVVAHVGDSRAYRLRAGALDQLTFDHSLVWEMKAAGQIPADQVPNYIPKNIITRSLGPNPQVQVDLEGPWPIQVGDTFLVCSDGLSGQLSDKELGVILACVPPKKAARVLVDLANLRGGPDNVTLVVVRVTRPIAAAGQTTSSRLARGADHRPVHAIVWTLLGVFVLAALVMLVMGQRPLSAASAIAALVMGVVALVQHYSRPAPPVEVDGARTGHGPYTRTDATPDAETVDRLAKTTEELREAATKEKWPVDWATFDRYQSQGASSRQSGSLAEAVRAYCEAVSFMMTQLRQKGRRSPGDNRAV